MNTILAIVAAMVMYVIFIVAIMPASDENYGFDHRMRIFRAVCRVLLAIAIIAFASIKITRCQRERAYNATARICNLGYYDNDVRIDTLLDSLAVGNRVRFGRMLMSEHDRRIHLLDDMLPNDYSVGYQDTVSGERFEVEITITADDHYDGESWTTDYRNKITRITLRNPRGIRPKQVAISPDYLVGASGFDRGYCAIHTDTLASLFTY